MKALTDAANAGTQAGNMTAEAQTWKVMQEHMNTIADALTGGIAAQFPDKAR